MKHVKSQAKDVLAQGPNKYIKISCSFLAVQLASLREPGSLSLRAKSTGIVSLLLIVLMNTPVQNPHFLPRNLTQVTSCVYAVLKY